MAMTTRPDALDTESVREIVGYSFTHPKPHTPIVARRCQFAKSEEGVVKRELAEKWDEPVSWIGETIAMKKPSKHLIAEVPRSVAKARMTIGIDLGDVWSHYCYAQRRWRSG